MSSDNINYNYDVHIVGAGFCGSLLALLLAKQHGLKVALFESRKDLRKNILPAGRSINLALARRGIDALEVAGVMSEVLKHVVPMYGRQLHGIDNKQQLVGYSKNLSQAIYSLSRSKLNEILLDAAEATGLVDCYFMHECTNLDPEKQIIEFNYNLKTSFRLCIGADGFASKVREYIIPKDQVSIEPLGHSYKELTIPAKSNNYQMVINALHIWPRGEYMLIALPNSDPSFTATLFLPDNTELSLNNFKSAQDIRNFFVETFSDVPPLIPDLTEQFFANPIGRLATVRCKTWHNKRTVLMGDAAHAIVPFHGQGMNCAFEDALCYSSLYKEYKDDIIFLNEKYVEFRLDNANAIADMALENYIEMRDTVASTHFKIKKDISWLLQDRYNNKYIPRYNMVMFENIPYSRVKQLGVMQKKILEQLASKISSIENLDLELADKLVANYIEEINRPAYV